MKRVAIALSLLAFVAAPAGAAEQEGAAEFTLIILGTRSVEDVDVIRKNLGTLPYVTLFVPTSARPKRLEFVGRMSGDIETLVADVKSLAEDRYDVNVSGGEGRPLIITMRRIRDDRPER